MSDSQKQSGTPSAGQASGSRVPTSSRLQPPRDDAPPSTPGQPRQEEIATQDAQALKPPTDTPLPGPLAPAPPMRGSAEATTPQMRAESQASSSLSEIAALLLPSLPPVTAEEQAELDRIPIGQVADEARRSLDELIEAMNQRQDLRQQQQRWLTTVTGTDVSQSQITSAPEASQLADTGQVRPGGSAGDFITPVELASEQAANEGDATDGGNGDDLERQDADEKKLSTLQRILRNELEGAVATWTMNSINIFVRDTLPVTFLYTVREYIELATQNGVEEKSDDYKENVVSGLMGGLLFLTIGAAYLQRRNKTATVNSEVGWGLNSAILLVAFGLAKKTETLAGVLPIVTKGIIAPILRDGAYLFLPKVTAYRTKEQVDPEKQVNQTLAATTLGAVTYGSNQYVAQLAESTGLSGSGAATSDASVIQQLGEVLRFSAAVSYGETVEQFTFPAFSAAFDKTKPRGQPAPADMSAEAVWKRMRHNVGEALENVGDLRIKIGLRWPSLADLSTNLQTGMLPREHFFMSQFLVSGCIAQISNLDQFSENQQNALQMLCYVAANFVLYFPYVLSTKLRKPPMQDQASPQVIDSSSREPRVPGIELRVPTGGLEASDQPEGPQQTIEAPGGLGPPRSPALSSHRSGSGADGSRSSRRERPSDELPSQNTAV